MMNNISTVSDWLERSCSLKVPSDWLSACLEWIEEENEDSDLTLEQIKNLVYEQWLLSDLCDLKTQYLPDDIQIAEKCEVSGPIPLQVNKIVDIGVSTYSQLQKLQGTENDNVNVSADQPKQQPWEPKPSRMLLMQLTDGFSEIQGMEYRSIPDLTPDLPPGIKIMLLGTVLCRRAMLMLKRENVKVLGGEVDTLTETNSKIQVLQELLQKNKEDSGREFKETYEGGPAHHSSCKEDFDMENSFKTEIRNRTLSPKTQSSLWTSSVSQKSAPNLSRHGTTSSNKYNLLPKKEVPQLSEQEWDTDFNYENLMDEMEELDCQVSSTNSGFPKSDAPTPPININININMPPQIKKSVPTEKSNLSNSRRQDAMHYTHSSKINNPSGKFVNHSDYNLSKSSLGSMKKPKWNSTFAASNDIEDMDFDDDFEVIDSWKTPSTQTPVHPTSSLSNKKTNSVKQKQTTVKDSLLTTTLKKQTSLSTLSPLPCVGQKGKRNCADEQQNSNLHSTLESFMNNRNSLHFNDATNHITEMESESISRQPFTYLSAVEEYLKETDVKKAKFYLKAYVSTICSKLESNGGQRWSLSCKINDGTGSLDCDISNIIMKKKIKEEPELKDIIIEGIQQCQEKLINLSCIMEIETTRFSGNSEITKLVPLAEQHTEILHKIVATKVNSNSL